MKELITLEQVNEIVGKDMTDYVEEAKNYGRKTVVGDYTFWLLGEFDERKKVFYGNVYMYAPGNKVYTVQGTYTRFKVDTKSLHLLDSIKKLWAQIRNKKSKSESAITKVA